MRRLVALGLAVGLLGGCGISAEDRPRALTSPTPTATASATTSATRLQETGMASTVYLVRTVDRRLVPRTRFLSDAPTAADLLASLLNGPDDEESDSGFTSAVAAGTRIVRTPDPTSRVVTIEVPDAVTTDENLAYAQVVLTLSRLPLVAGIQFVRDGEPVLVPDDGSRLVGGVLTSADFRGLVGEG